MQSLFMVVGAILLVVIAVPWVLPVLLPLLIGFAWCRHVYMAASRDVKRFDNITRSPVYAFVSSTLKARPQSEQRHSSCVSCISGVCKDTTTRHRIRCF